MAGRIRGLLLVASCMGVWGAATSARADVGVVATPERIWALWNWSPVVLLCSAFVGTAYARGVWRLWRVAGRQRGVSSMQMVSFYAGLGAWVLALVSPLDALGSTLFCAHMVQHLVLIVIAAPLFVLGRPVRAFVWALPRHARASLRRAYHGASLNVATRTVRRPLVALGLHTAALWLWHMPALYELALTNDIVHGLEHVSFFGTAALLWAALLQTGRHHGLRILYLFASATQGAVLGALITMSPSAWYAIHEPGARVWGLQPLEDQQLAGLIMWVPGGIVYVIAALVSFSAWLSAAERSVDRHERRRGAWRSCGCVVAREGTKAREGHGEERCDALQSRS